MSNSILGNNEQYSIYLTFWEFEDEENEETLEFDGEMVDTYNITGYRAVVPKNSQSYSVQIYFYYKAPVSEWYWDYQYGKPYSAIIPLVYSCDNDWKLNECLNQNYYETSLDGRSDGWVTLSVTLKRKLIKDEKIFFGVYADILGIVATDYAEPSTTMCFFYYSTVRRKNYASQIAFITSAEVISKMRGLSCDWEVCIYMEYENEADAIAYSRTVIGYAGLEASVAKRKHWAYRYANNTANFYTRPFASRIFYRVCATVMGLWDWLRGKIREANNVVTLFCAIADEIILECKI